MVSLRKTRLRKCKPNELKSLEHTTLWSITRMKSQAVIRVNEIVSNSKTSKMEDKRYRALNGSDSALRKGARLLFLSAEVKEEPRQFGNRTFTSQFFWAIDLDRKELVKVSRSGLAGGMGYEDLPEPGDWKTSADGQWEVLTPNPKDPAIKTRQNWGIRYVAPGCFTQSGDTVRIPRIFILEVERIQWLASRNPISMTDPTREREELDKTFRPYGACAWYGSIKWVAKEELAKLVKDLAKYMDIDLAKDAALLNI